MLIDTLSSSAFVNHSGRDANVKPGDPKTNLYLSRYWRGDLPLVPVLWINIAIACIVLSAGSAVATAAYQGGYQPTHGAVSLISLWIGASALILWLFVGLWRSAKRRAACIGRPGLRNVVKSLVAAGLAGAMLAIVLEGAMGISQSLKIAAGDPNIGGHEIFLSPSGTEIVFSGGITFGVTENVRRVLDGEGSKAKVIRLEGSGGRLVEAHRFRDLVRERGLIAYSGSQCLSACTIVFMAGSESYIGPQAQLGFHGVRQIGMTSSGDRDNRQESDELIAAGVAPAFAERAYGTPNDQIWIPAPEELIRAGVAHGMVDEAQLASLLSGDR
jgi:hypothetical protein